jgi:hypothetical protein
MREVEEAAEHQQNSVTYIEKRKRGEGGRVRD